uniref:Putative secreted protein n=1 Tax=Ixodes ricinus TaxID=34613 RepID=A0A6B0UFA1_IXORI
MTLAVLLNRTAPTRCPSSVTLIFLVIAFASATPVLRLLSPMLAEASKAKNTTWRTPRSFTLIDLSNCSSFLFNLADSSARHVSWFLKLPSTLQGLSK